MTPSQKLRSIADSTGLDGIADAIREIAEEIEHNPAPAVLQEPVIWQYRTWFAENTGTPGWSEWAEVTARNAYTGTVMDSVREFQHYIAQGYKYEIRALYAATPAPAPAQEPVACGLCQGSGVLIPTQKCICQYGGKEPAQEVRLTDEAVNDAARVLAERFDYPWEHMPEEGRKNMRVQARAVVEAALRAKGASDA